jgi:hypothetical protein
MRLFIATVEQTPDKQHACQNTTKYVRKSWSVFVAYYFVTSLAVGFGITVAMFLFAAFDGSKLRNHKPLPDHAPWLFLMAFLGVLSAIIFLIQLVSGPFVFTKDVVCRKCHSRLNVKRIAFFTGKYSRPPRCECGGRIEPAFLWKAPGIVVGP